LKACMLSSKALESIAPDCIVYKVASCNIRFSLNDALTGTSVLHGGTPARTCPGAGPSKRGWRSRPFCVHSLNASSGHRSAWPAWAGRVAAWGQRCRRHKHWTVSGRGLSQLQAYWPFFATDVPNSAICLIREVRIFVVRLVTTL
jgi:hypothetical protein